MTSNVTAGTLPPGSAGASAGAWGAGGGLPCAAQAVQARADATAGLHQPHVQELWDGVAMAKRGATLTDVAAPARDTLFADLDLASRALLLSQAGPDQAGRVLHVLPTAAELRLPSELFRIVLLRRLRMPLPASGRAYRCGRPADALGDHVAACPTSGVLRTRAAPVERAIARVCREAGGRVAMHVQVAEMNVDVPVSDARRIEILRSLTPRWSARSGGTASPGQQCQASWGCEQAARRKRETTYPELLAARRCRLASSSASRSAGGTARRGIKRGSGLSGCVPQRCRPFSSAGPALLPSRDLTATLAGLPRASQALGGWQRCLCRGVSCCKICKAPV